MQSAQYCAWRILNAQMSVLLFGSTKLEPGQRFPMRGLIVLLTGHLAMSEDIFWLLQLGEGLLLSSSGFQARDAAQHLTMHRTAPHNQE